MPTTFALPQALRSDPQASGSMKLASSPVLPETRMVLGTRTILSGGYNNMLMNIAQMLALACHAKPPRTLLLPHLDADPLGSRSQPPLRFSDIFDVAAFASGVRPCNVTTDSGLFSDSRHSGTPGVDIAWIVPKPIRGRWNHSAILATVYHAARPSVAVQAVVAALEKGAAEHAGPNWDAIHLTIERDWWYKLLDEFRPSACRSQS